MKLTKLLSLSFATMLAVVFMAGCKQEDEDPGVRPRVTSTSPISNATGVATNGQISVQFSAEMDPSTITDAKFIVKAGNDIVAGTVVYASTIATFVPTANFSANTLYTVTITTGAKDALGKSLAKDYVWSFTTGAIPDIIKPTVTLSSPANNAIGIALNSTIVTTFSEAMDQSTISSLTVSVKQGTTVVAGVVTYENMKATFTPSVNLTAEKVYTATVSLAAKDMSGNSLAAINTVSFTTVAAPDIALPRVNATDPLNNATNVAVNKAVELTFSEAMDPLTITAATFTLKQGLTSVSGVVTYVDAKAKFTPSVVLTEGLVYTATITTGAKDAAGNALAANTVWSFTTVVAANMPVVDLGAAGNYVILAKSAISNISTSAVTGDLGLSPAATSYITGLSLTNATGFATSTQVTGKIYAADMATPTDVELTTAVANMITAYNDAAGRPSPDFSELGTGNIGGQTLAPGLYKWTTSVTMPSDVTISGGPNAVWIFQISGDLGMAPAVRINLTGGAQAKNIFWQVAGEATLGTTTHFEGIILSMTAITFQTGASLSGRALAQTAVVLDGNAITKPQ
jgi:methionine-rich copper-binding protein CopC